MLAFGGGTGGGFHLDTPSVDLTPHASATAFTLSFDHYQNTGTNTSLIIAFNDTTSGYVDAVSETSFKWVGADTSAFGLNGLIFRFDPTTAETWHHFDLDVTSAITPYLTSISGPSTDFRVGFQNWTGGAGGSIQQIYLDNLTLTATSAVPEPSTYAAILGACALGSSPRVDVANPLGRALAVES